MVCDGNEKGRQTQKHHKMCIRDRNFSADLMEAAKNALERITDAAANLKDRKAAAQTDTATDAEKELLAQAQEFVKKFEEAMDDDFNTADALAAIFELVKFANTNGQDIHLAP